MRFFISTKVCDMIFFSSGGNVQINPFKTRALNAVSIHQHFKDLLRSYKNLGYLVEIPQ